MSAAVAIETDRCEVCGGLYGNPDLEADPYDFPCCCPWPADQQINPVLGERFTQDDGKPGWYSADGLYVLRTTPVVAAFNGPDGQPLYLYPNMDVRKPRGEPAASASVQQELADARAHVTRLQARVVELEDQLARLASEDSREALARLTHERAVDRARLEQTYTILERPDLPPLTRIVGAIAAKQAIAYRLPLALGEEPERSEPTPINVAEVERLSGAAQRSASHHLAPLAEAGLLTREIRKVAQETATGELEFRTTVLIGPGTGCSAPRIRDRRRDRERERLQRLREERAERERTLAARITELEAAAEAAARGCPICGGDLLATGYVCKHCGSEHTTAALAALPTVRDISSNPSQMCVVHPPNTLDHRWVYDAHERQPNGNAAEPRQRHTQDHTGLPRGRIIP